jgi:hypothetical protein
MSNDKKATVGSRAQVMHGTADHTSGGLKKSDLKYNAYGKIVSKAASAAGHKAYARNKDKMATPYGRRRSTRSSKRRSSRRLSHRRSSRRSSRRASRRKSSDKRGVISKALNIPAIFKL